MKKKRMNKYGNFLYKNSYYIIVIAFVIIVLSDIAVTTIGIYKYKTTRVEANPVIRRMFEGEPEAMFEWVKWIALNLSLISICSIGAKKMYDGTSSRDIVTGILFGLAITMLYYQAKGPLSWINML